VGHDSESRFGGDADRKPVAKKKPMITGLALAALASVATCSMVGALQPPATAGEAAAADPAAPCDRDGAKGRLLIATGQGLVKGYDPGSGGIVMVVRRGPWDDLSVDDQQRLASSLDCAMAGPGGIVGFVKVRDELAGEDLASFDNIALLGFREAGFDRPSATTSNRIAPRRRRL